VYTGSFETDGRENWHATFLEVDNYWDWVQHDRVYGGFPWVRGPGYCRV
jgi:hypothetical protein